MQRSIFRNLALSLLHGLGVGSMFPSAIPDAINHQPTGRTRWGRNSQARTEHKNDFARALATELDPFDIGEPPKHIGLARKAALGEVGIRYRGLQSRRVSGTGRNSVFRITR